MELVDKYRIVRMPDGNVALEVEREGALVFAMILTPHRARTMATKLRNATLPSEELEAVQREVRARRTYSSPPMPL